MAPDSLFLDYNSGAPVRPEVLDSYVQALRDYPANPAALHHLGRRAHGALEQARDQVAALMGCAPREIVFTASATEGNNLALLGAARAARRLHGGAAPLVSSAAEHPSVLGPLRLLQQEGHRLTLVPIDRHARPTAAALLAAAAEQRAALVGLQWANNETGAIQDLPGLARGLPAELHWHCDAVQGLGKLPWEPALQSAATLVVAGHKIGAPKGIAVLRVSDRAFLEPVLGGGGQQRKLRPGTETPALAVAFARALELAVAEQPRFARSTEEASQALLEELRRTFPGMRENQPAERLPNTLSLSFPGIDGRMLLLACDAEGLAVSSGSACSSGAAQPSAVLRAAGLDEAMARATLRISFGADQGAAEGRAAGRRLSRLLHRLYEIANR